MSRGMNASGGLPDQGFDGHSTEMVEHKDAETQTADWGSEWPQTEETEGEVKERICNSYPNLLWCKMFMAKRNALKIPKVSGIWRTLGWS
mmetsp:Transcript_14888/g.34214  ORF Transcript_14888/g.34214 Transcript_14888/m.34214 type:complete len:90 (+) Transcript_14888:2-271(+)